MFCDGCGKAVQPGQPFCSGCGKEILGPVMATVRPGRVQGHVHLLGIFWLAISAFNTIGAVILYILANTLFLHLHELGAPPYAPVGFLRPLLSVVAIFVLAKAACGFIAGWGLLHREPWARIVVLVLGFISLFNVPFGTAVGIYTLWALLPAQSQAEYDAMAAARAA